MTKKPPKLQMPSFPSAEITGTVAENCLCSGEGLTFATCGIEAVFTIEARDAKGMQMKCGGDHFFVYIRGPSRVRANITDNKNGTYAVKWRVQHAGTRTGLPKNIARACPPTHLPSLLLYTSQTYTSGQYYVAVSLFGLNLPGSPFPLYVFAPHAHAPQCEVSGGALAKAFARVKNTFEIQFRDKLGQIAQAVDVDVFAELLEASGRPSVPQQFSKISPKGKSHQGTHGSATTLRESSVARGFQWAPAVYLAHFSNTASPSSSPSQTPSSSPEPSKRSSSRRTMPKLEKLKTKQAELLLPVHPTERIDGTASERAASRLPDGVKKGRSAVSAAPTGGGGMGFGFFGFGNDQSQQLPTESERARLDIAKRQQHSQMWSRRESIDKLSLKNEDGVAISRGQWYVPCSCLRLQRIPTRACVPVLSCRAGATKRRARGCMSWTLTRRGSPLVASPPRSARAVRRPSTTCRTRLASPAPTCCTCD